MPGISLLLDLWHPEGGGETIYFFFSSGLHPHALPAVPPWLTLFILNWSASLSQQESKRPFFSRTRSSHSFLLLYALGI